MSLRRVCVVGGNGSLGLAVRRSFARAGWGTVSVDFVGSDSAGSSGSEHEEQVLLRVADTLEGKLDHMIQQVASSCERAGDFDAVINVAGSWAGGGVDSPDVARSVDHMWHANVTPAVNGESRWWECA